MAFFPLEKCSNLFDGYQKPFTVDDQQILLLQIEGQVYAIENRCPHMDVALTDAVQLPDHKIRCRAHGIAFSLTSGKAEGPLAKQLECLKQFSVDSDGEYIGVQISN